MKALILRRITDLEKNRAPLELVDIPLPETGDGEVLIKVSRCGVCHTELDEIEGRTPPTRFPIVLGHQIVGKIARAGIRANRFKLGERVGVAWIHSACGRCRFCIEGRENLCNEFVATGRDADGGYAEYSVVSEDFAYRIPDIFSDSEAAPLLCAGAIGYRSLRLAGLQDGENLGLSGFGASGHIVQKIVGHQYPNSKVFVFSRTPAERDFAREQGAYWTGSFEEAPPEKLRAVIDTTPVWRPVVIMLKSLERGGRLVINAIRKEERDRDALIGLDYTSDLWMEKEIKSVANITRKDVEDFLRLSAEIPLSPEIQEYAFEDANRALLDLKERRIRGAKVLRIG